METAARHHLTGRQQPLLPPRPLSLGHITSQEEECDHWHIYHSSGAFWRGKHDNQCSMTPASASSSTHLSGGSYYTRRWRIRGRYSLQWVWRWRGWSGCSWGSQRGYGNLAKGWRMRIEPRRNRVTRYGIVKCVTYRITNGSPRWAAYDIFGWFFRIIRRIYFPEKKH